MSDISFFDNTSSNSSLPPPDCLNLRTSRLILMTFCLADMLLVLPLSTLILYLEYQRRRQAAVVTGISHSDIFTYHMLAMEMIVVLGCLFLYIGININHELMIICGIIAFVSPWSIKIHFYTLTCVEHYLAVVHPVTYLGLKSTGGIRIRNICISCLWLLCFVYGVVVFQTNIAFCMILQVCIVGLALAVVCFCCISVLCALRRPGPHEVGRDSDRVDQVKRRTFNTVVTIMAVLWFCLGGMLVCNVIMKLQLLSFDNGCNLLISSIWFSLPSSWVLPVLYLKRTGKLTGCRRSVN